MKKIFTWDINVTFLLCVYVSIIVSSVGNLLTEEKSRIFNILLPTLVVLAGIIIDCIFKDQERKSYLVFVGMLGVTLGGILFYFFIL